MLIAQGYVLESKPEISHRPELLTYKRRPGKRGRVVTFSAASRKRMRNTLFRIARVGAVFLTLTQREHIQARDYVRHLRAFDVALRRRYPVVGAVVWRLEEQRRGALHAHMLIYPKAGHRAPFLDKFWVIEMWGRITHSNPDNTLKNNLISTRGGGMRRAGMGGMPSVSLQWIPASNQRKLARYVSKYISKIDDAEPEPERSDGEGEAACSLDDNDIIAQGYRRWGITGRQYIVWAAVRRVTSVNELSEFLQHQVAGFLGWMLQSGYNPQRGWSLVLWDRLTD